MSLCSENLQKDPKILQSAAAGQYQLIFLSPEVLSMENSVFRSLVGSKVIRGPLGGIVIDEVHLCHQW